MPGSLKIKNLLAESKRLLNIDFEDPDQAMTQLQNSKDAYDLANQTENRNRQKSKKFKSKKQNKKKRYKYDKSAEITQNSEYPSYLQNLQPCLKKKRKDLNECLQIYDQKMYSLKLKLEKKENQFQECKEKMIEMRSKLQKLQYANEEKERMEFELNRQKAKESAVRLEMEKWRNCFTECVVTLQDIECEYQNRSKRLESNFERELELMSKINKLGLENMRENLDRLIYSLNDQKSDYEEKVSEKKGEKIYSEIAKELLEERADLRKKMVKLSTDNFIIENQKNIGKMDYWNLVRENKQLKNIINTNQREWNKKENDYNNQINLLTIKLSKNETTTKQEKDVRQERITKNNSSKNLRGKLSTSLIKSPKSDFRQKLTKKTLEGKIVPIKTTGYVSNYFSERNNDFENKNSERERTTAASLMLTDFKTWRTNKKAKTVRGYFKSSSSLLSAKNEQSDLIRKSHFTPQIQKVADQIAEELLSQGLTTN